VQTAVKNTMNQAIAIYETSSGQVKLSPAIVRNYLVNGNGNVTDQEVMMFLSLCRYQKLNPFLREAYLIKYGTQAATIVVGKETFTKRAESHQQFDGMEAGIIIKHQDKFEYRSGALLLKNEDLVGGWAKIYRKDWKHPADVTVSLTEYQQMKDGKPMASWGKMPATMIRKVAVMQALREAFPNELGGMYGAEEMQVEVNNLPTEHIDITPEPQLEAVKEQAQQPRPANGNGVKMATEPQQKRLYAMAKEAGMPNEEMKEMMKEATGKKSSKELTKDEIKLMFDVVDSWKSAKESEYNIPDDELPPPSEVA